MSVKCKACGFDSPDGAGWCEFCKEPFNKKKTRPTPAEAAGAHAAAAELAAQLPPAELSKLKQLPPEELLKRLPVELSRDASAQPGIPRLPAWFRPAAYAFVAALAAMTALLIYTTMAKIRNAPLHDDVRDRLR